MEGKVTGIKPFGAFVALPESKTGLVHISEVSYEFVQDLATVLEAGQTVKVKVISIAPDGKIALSIKQTQPAPERAGNHAAWGKLLFLVQERHPAVPIALSLAPNRGRIV